MKYLDTAFAQLSFAWKLYHYALDGRISLDDLDQPLVIESEDRRFVLATLPDKIFHGANDMVHAFTNNVTIAYGAAAITLNRCREEQKIDLADPIVTAQDQWAAVIYQVRNAFAHDIAEPRWNIIRPRYARLYDLGDFQIDLTNLRTKPFEYADLGGPDVLYWLKSYGEERGWI